MRHKLSLQPKIALQAAALALLLWPVGSIAARNDTVDTWRIRETLVSRLSGEWYKIGVLRRELAGMEDVLADLRNIEVFPERVIKLSEDRLVAFDKSIEKIDKNVKSLSEQTEALRAPLSDALAILKEMVVGEAVEDMFLVIEQGDMERIGAMLSIKHELDDAWKDIEKLIVGINRDMGLPPFPVSQEETGLEREFFEILRANLGRQSEEYYHKLNILKDSLATRANDIEIKSMLAIEANRVRALVEEGKDESARKKISAIRDRYKDRTEITEINVLLTRIHFRLGNYEKAIAVAAEIPSEPPYDTTKALFTVQSRYALHRFREIWDWAEEYDFSTFAGTHRNVLLWLTMESGLAVGAEVDYSKIAGNVVKDQPYHLHVLHCLARSYFLKGKPSTALSILDGASKMKPGTDVDRKVHKRILLTLAQTYYENGEYEKSLKGFFHLLNTAENFEEALFGMAWCYIKLGAFQKAETTLRKLINQNPESPRAAEAILLMARRYANKAQFEWDKLQYLTRQTVMLTDMKAALTTLYENADDSLQAAGYKANLDTVTAFLVRLTTEEREDYDGIKALYTKAKSVCELVIRHYETGSFQEISFSQNREKLLHKLDSLLLAIQGEKTGAFDKNALAADARSVISKVKELARSSAVLTAELTIDQYKWEVEFLDWKKSQLAQRRAAKEKVCENLTDTLARDTCRSELASITPLIDSLVEQGDALNALWYDRIVEQCTNMLRVPLDPGDEIYLRYHLGELYYRKENEDFAQAYEVYEKAYMKYEKQLQRFRSGEIDEMPRDPEIPRLSHDKSLMQYRTALKKFPDHPDMAPVHYSMAWCYNDLGRFDSAVTHMAQVAGDYTNSSYAPQAWMYLGEYYFENAKLEKAITAYQKVMTSPESEWFDEALYKLAWTQYRLSNPEKAISSFLALVGLGELEGAGKALLEKESLDYIAISFSESDVSGEQGLERAAMFVEKLGDMEKGTQILHRLASVYKEQGRYEMSKNTYWTLLQMYPTYHESPLVEGELLAVEERNLPLAEACEKKITYFNKYRRDGEWALAQGDSSIIAKADSAASEQLYDAAITYHQMALQNNDQSIYKNAAKNYERFIRYYPKSPKANESHYNFAEILFSLGDYRTAAEEYIAVSRRYPDSKYKETAAWNAIVASQNLLRLEEADNQ